MKVLYTLTFCLFIATMAFGQAGSGSKKKSDQIMVRVIDYDDRETLTEQVILDEVVRQGDLIRLQIRNINRLTHKIEFKTETRNYVTEMSPGMAAALGIKNDNKESESKDSGGVEKTESAVESMKNLTADSKSISISAEMNTLVTKCEELLQLSKELKEIKHKRLELIELLKSDASTYQSLMDKVKSVYPSSPDISTITKTISDYLKSYEAAKVAYEAAESAAFQKQLEILSIAKVSFSGNKDVDAFEKAMEQSRFMTEAKEKIQKANTDIKEGYETLEGEDVYAFASDIKKLHDQLTKEENFISMSDPVKMNGDYVAFTVQVTPRDAKDKETRSFEIEIPGKGGWKTDFSLGPVFSMGSGAKDDKHYLEAAGDSSFLRYKSNKNTLRPGLASMMHIYRRTPKDTQVGFSFGVGADFSSIDDADLSYYLGLSAILGKVQKVYITAGMSFLKVDRSTDEYKLDMKYPTDVITAATITDKTIRGAFFFSLSYSLAKKQDTEKAK